MMNRSSDSNKILQEHIDYLEARSIDVLAEYYLLLDINPNAAAWTLDELSEEDQHKYRQEAMDSLKIWEPWVMVQLEECRVMLANVIIIGFFTILVLVGIILMLV